MSKSAPREQHHIVGGGIAGLATVVFLIRDAGVKGKNIHIMNRSGSQADLWTGRGTQMADT